MEAKGKWERTERERNGKKEGARKRKKRASKLKERLHAGAEGE